MANAILRDTSDSEWRFYFMLCIHGYQDLYPSFPIVGGIVQGLLAIAVDNGGMSTSEARLLNQELHDKRPGHLATDRIKGNFAVDLDLAVTDREGAHYERLVDKFEEISLFDAFTQGVF